MKINILTIFPDFFKSLNNYGIIGKAINKEILNLNIINIRDFSKSRHKKVDDEPYGGGAGMLMSAQPIHDAITSIKESDNYVIYLSPQGQVLTQKKVEEFSKYKNISLLCGHYEGIDQRIIELDVDEELSIGDYVLTGGEIPALVFIDTVSRYINGVVGNPDCVDDDSLTNNYLKHPEYTRPREFLGKCVPEVLLNGNHEKILNWKKNESYKQTLRKRPDLLEKK